MFFIRAEHKLEEERETKSLHCRRNKKITTEVLMEMARGRWADWTEEWGNGGAPSAGPEKWGRWCGMEGRLKGTERTRYAEAGGGKRVPGVLVGAHRHRLRA